MNPSYPPVHRAGLGRALLSLALLFWLASFGDAAARVEEETPAAETVVATPATVAAEPVTELAAEPTNETPSAASGLQPATTRTRAPSARKTAPAPVPAPTPTATATPAADPHAGHDVPTMSDDNMQHLDTP